MLHGDGGSRSLLACKYDVFTFMLKFVSYNYPPTPTDEHRLQYAAFCVFTIESIACPESLKLLGDLFEIDDLRAYAWIRQRAPPPPSPMRTRLYIC